MLARGELSDQQLAELRSMPVDVRRAMAATLIGLPRKRALSPTINGGAGFEDGPDDSDGTYDGDSLAQAIHDLCADAGANCRPTNSQDTPYGRSGRLSISDAYALAGKPRPLSIKEAIRFAERKGNLSVADAERRLAERRGNLSVADAERMCGRSSRFGR